jgi:hypothetical protein
MSSASSKTRISNPTNPNELHVRRRFGGDYSFTPRFGGDTTRFAPEGLT